MKTRVKTGIALVAAVLVLMAFSHNHWVMKATAAFLSFMAAQELFTVSGLEHKNGMKGACMAVALLMAFAQFPGYEIVVAVLLPVAVVFFAFLMTRIGKGYALQPWHVVTVSVLASVFFASIKYIRVREFGLWELIMGILVCMITDSCAYLVGCPFGRHKLAPKVSPAKSVEGAVGGSICGVVAMVLVNYLFYLMGGPQVHYRNMTVYLLLASIVGQWGDLSLSAFKRIAGIKDYGNLLPGHGGILDRFDSQLFCLPFTYLFCVFCGNLYL